jgi:hypothetical protein
MKLTLTYALSKTFTVLFLTSQLVSCTDAKKEGRLVIGTGTGPVQIIIPDEADEVMRFAASELSDYLEKITGNRTRIIPAAAANDKRVYIHLIQEKNDSLKWDGFRVETSLRGIGITASESRGLLYGVYTLLEEAGCSFFYPGKDEEVVPRLEKLEFGEGTRIYNPLLEHRGLTPYGLQGSTVEAGRDFIDWMAKNRMNFILISEDRPSDCDGPAHASIWKEVSDELLPELQKRGFVIEMSEHCTHVFFPRSLFKQHPDWFALNGGVRKLGEPPYSGQMCYANQDAVDYYADALANYAAAHPEFHIIGTWPLDGSNYCECEACRDPQTILNAAKQVAEKVRKVRPDMIVEHLAYRPQTWQPPEDKLPENMSVLWCPDIGVLDDLAKEWIQKTGQAGGVYQFEYNMGDNYRTRANIWLRPVFSAGLVKNAVEIGFRGVNSLYLTLESWWRPCFNNWFFARACWDPGFDTKAGLREYCQKYYGKHAPEIEAVFSSILTELHPEPYRDIEDGYYTDQISRIQSTADKLRYQLDRIMENCTDPVMNVRMARLRTYVAFFRLYVEAFVDRKQENMEELIRYLENHPEHRMVLIYPEYFRWRNQELFPR